MNSNKAGLGKIASEVSKHVNIREDIVKMILDGYAEVVAEKIINEGEFLMPGIFSVSEKPWKAQDGAVKTQAHNRLTVRLSFSLRKMYQAVQKDNRLRIDRENWRSERRNYAPDTYKKNNTQQSSISLADLLDDDEDY